MSSELVVRGHTLYLPAPDSNVGWVRVGEVFIMFARSGKAPEDRMNMVVEGLQDDDVKVMVGTSLGAIQLTSTQRKQLSDCAKGKKLISIMDPNPITRGIVTALRWFGLKIELIYWTQLDKAIDSIDPQAVDREDLRAVLETIHQFLTGNVSDRIPAAS